MVQQRNHVAATLLYQFVPSLRPLTRAPCIPTTLTIAANVRNSCEATISLSGSLGNPISAGTLGLAKLLEGKSTLRVVSKVSFDSYERLDARVLQIAIVRLIPFLRGLRLIG